MVQPTGVQSHPSQTVKFYTKSNLKHLNHPANRFTALNNPTTNSSITEIERNKRRPNLVKLHPKTQIQELTLAS
eukprot:gene13204-9050_t